MLILVIIDSSHIVEKSIGQICLNLNEHAGSDTHRRPSARDALDVIRVRLISFLSRIQACNACGKGNTTRTNTIQGCEDGGEDKLCDIDCKCEDDGVAQRIC